MYSRNYAVTLNGATPLLMSHDNLSWADSMDAWRKEPGNKKMSTAGDDRTPAWRWIGKLYTEGGVVAMPSDNLMTMMREGGAKCPTGKRQGTFKRQTQSGIVVNEPAWPLVSAKGTIPVKKIEALIENAEFADHESVAKELGFSLFVKRGNVGQNKHIRVRPRFDVWSCSGTMTVFDETITDTVLKDIIEASGVFCGLCDWRPSSPRSPGPWGKFTCEVKKL